MKQRSIASFFGSAVKSGSTPLVKDEKTTDGVAAPSVAEGQDPKPQSCPLQNTKVYENGLAPGGQKSPGLAHQLPGCKENEPGAQTYGEEVVGRGLEVFWPDDRVYYKGIVHSYDKKTGQHTVLYVDDDETETLTLHEEKFRWLNSLPQKPPAKKRRVLLSDDEDVASLGPAPSSSSSGSDFEGGADEDGDDDDDEVDLMDEEPDEDQDLEETLEDLEDDDAPAGTTKRKRASSGRKSSTKKVSAKGTTTVPPSTPTCMAPVIGEAGSLTPKVPGETPRGFLTPLPGAVACKADAGNTPFQWPPTPNTEAKAHLHNVFELTPQTSKKAAAPVEVVHGVQTVQNSDNARFLARMSQRFPFLHPDRIKDHKQRRPDHPLYNPRTLLIPPGWFKEAKVTEAQQQWWHFKSKNFDSVLLFKMGKFYEMFEMDAYVGVEVLGLSFMKGEQPHAGFPEAVYHQMAEALARAGYRVVVVEQTETPDQLKVRNDERRRMGQKMVNVVERQKVAVLSKGTLVDAEMVSSQPDAAYVMAVQERVTREDDQGGAGCPTESCMLGLCAVDVASGQMIVGQFKDDEVRGQLRSHLTALQPVEVIMPRNQLSPTTQRVLKTSLRHPQVNVISEEDGHSWAPQDVADNVVAYFENRECPKIFEQWKCDPSSQAAALSSLGLMLSFLKEALLDKAVVPLARVDLLPDLQGTTTAYQDQNQAHDGQMEEEEQGQQHLLLNGAALENLEVLENSTGGSAGTLLSVLDHCCTPFGRRRLRQWLYRPLYRVADIAARQDAVEELLGNASEASGLVRKNLAGVSDLERAIARLHASTVEGAEGRHAAHVILYEDAAKRKVKGMVAAIQDLKGVHTAMQHLRDIQGQLTSPLLLGLVGSSHWEEMGAALEQLWGATDWAEAEQTGRVIPAEGVDEEYDRAKQHVEEAERRLDGYLKEVRQRLGGSREVVYVSVNKDSHLIEVPDHLAAKVSSSFDLVAHRKGFKRYSSDHLRELVKEHEEGLEEVEAALGSILQSLIKRLVDKKELWMRSVEVVAELDALMSLASHALGSDGTMCRPQFVAPVRSSPTSCPFVLDAKALRHPAGVSGRDGTFVPNDISLGGSTPGFLMLTGPNMGGKSTMLRQTCLAVVLAQVGACVPAESLTLSPVDAIFVRMGARDSILTGQSTFFIELSETAAMLQKATPRSLVALDELGRGTATSDGAAIASAVLEHLVHHTRCRGLFATHYHQLSEDNVSDPNVAIMHMACALHQGNEELDHRHGSSGGDGEEEDVRIEEVTFLYKLTAGSCPKSYGTNVAKLAGLSDHVVRRAAQISAQREAAQAVTHQRHRDNSEGSRLSCIPHSELLQDIRRLREILMADRPSIMADILEAQTLVSSHL